jgi:hypothetical protein
MPKFITNVIQGTYLSNHELLKRERSAQLFSIYSNDNKIANPVGSSQKKHKHCVFLLPLVEYSS